MAKTELAPQAVAHHHAAVGGRIAGAFARRLDAAGRSPTGVELDARRRDKATTRPRTSLGPRLLPDTAARSVSSRVDVGARRLGRGTT
jgi:hypothetical protein